MCTVLWPEEPIKNSIFALTDRLQQGLVELEKWKESGTCIGARMALAMALVHYLDGKLDVVTEGAPLLEDGSRVDVVPLLPVARPHTIQLSKYCDLHEHIALD